MMRLATSLQPDFGRLGLEDLDLDLNTPLSFLPRLAPGLAYVVDDFDFDTLVDDAGDYAVAPPSA